MPYSRCGARGASAGALDDLEIVSQLPASISRTRQFASAGGIGFVDDR